MSIVALKRIGQLAVLVRQQSLAAVDGKGQGSVFSGNPAVRVQRIAFGQRDRLRDHAGIRHRTVCQTAFVHLYGLARYRNVSAVRQIDLDLDRRTRRVAISVLCREREVTIRDLRGGSRSIRIADLAGGRIIRRLQLAAICIIDGRLAFCIKRSRLRRIGSVRHLQTVCLQSVSAGLQCKAAAFRRIGASGSARPFERIVGITADRKLRHIVHHVHRDGAVDDSAVRVRHRHGQIMGEIIHTGASMLQSVAAQFIGERQLARDRVEIRHRQDTFIRGHGVPRERAILKHDNAADHDGGHAVGGRDDQGTAGRGGRVGLPSLRTIRQAGFVHRHLIRTGIRIGRFDVDAIILAVDGDGHGARGYIAVRIRIGIGELFRQRFALGEFLHRRVVVVQPIAVGTVGIQGDSAKMPVLVRIPGKFCTVRASYRTRDRAADDGNGIPFRHLMREAFNNRHVVHHVHRNGRAGAVTVRIRHRHGQIMRDLRVRSGIALVMFRGVPVERIAEIQLARDRVIARHGQGAFICGHNVAGQLAIFVNHHVADDDGGHAVGGVDVQGAAGRSGRSGLTRLRTARQAAFIHRQIDRTRFRAGSDGHIVVDIDFRSAGLHGIRSKLRTAVETDIQTPQMIDAVQQIAAAVLVIAAAARGTAGGRAGGGHQVFAKGREEILPADLHTFHLEGRHLFLGIGGVEALQLDGRAILKSQDKIVAIAGQRRRIRGKVEDEASVRSAGDGLCGTSGRLGKTDIGHEGPPKKK